MTVAKGKALNFWRIFGFVSVLLSLFLQPIQVLFLFPYSSVVSFPCRGVGFLLKLQPAKESWTFRGD